MKKRMIISALVFTAASLLYGCGAASTGDADDLSADSEVSTSESSVVSEINDKTGITSVIVSGSEQPEVTSVPENSDNNDKPDEKKKETYEDAVRSYYDNVNNGEYRKVLDLMYPKDIIDRLLKSGQIDEDNLADEIGLEKSYGYEITDISVEEVLDDEVLGELTAQFDQMAAMLDILEEYGGDMNSLSEEQQNEIFQKYSELDPESIEHKYKASEGYDVTVSYKDGSEKKEECYYVVFVENEGWKMQYSMRKIIDKSIASNVRSDARLMMTQFIMSLSDVETQGTNVSGNYIISSDESKNKDVPSEIDTEQLKNEVIENMDISAKYINDYFVIISDGVCRFAAVTETRSEKEYTYYYPDSGNISVDGNDLEIDIEKKYTLDELYEIASEAIS